MTLRRSGRPAKISAVISDVDGTLVTKDKRLTEGAIAAAKALREAGIPFAIISSRPPRGLAMLIGPLGITTPVAGFNGGAIVKPDLSVIEEHLLAPHVARQSVAIITAQGAKPWVFGGNEWLAYGPDDADIARETHTVRFPPIFVADFGPALERAAKIVAVSNDTERLSRCEAAARAAFGDAATIARSQTYYLDFTHPLANKGTGLLALARLLGVPPSEVVAIGDGANDIAMFERCGFGIAMGNASSAVKAHAAAETESNEEDGFAKAIERFVLAPLRLGARA